MSADGALGPAPDPPPLETADPALEEALLAGPHPDPFRVLGPHRGPEGGRRITVYLPGASRVAAAPEAGGPETPLARIGASGLFRGAADFEGAYRLRIDWNGTLEERRDAYAFGPVLGEMDLHLFSEGTHFELGRRMGAQPAILEGVSGVAFSVWAPRARAVAVVGDFNSWDPRRSAMRRRDGGVFEIFLPEARVGDRYKFHILTAAGERLEKADPLARATERPPLTASVVAAPAEYAFTDEDWLRRRAALDPVSAPLSIYEVHAASWLRPEGDPSGVLDWDALAARLAPYVKGLGFTHVELMPVMEHPFGGSWGYQPLSQFAPSARFGPPEGFARFVDLMHAHGVGVILDWVPAHFPGDAHGLIRFDGQPLYEHADPREGFHPDWNSWIYDLSRPEVQGFLIASALHWIEAFHVDGVRVDAVASMLYRDYSRRAGEWIPNRYGGRENLEAIEFLQRLTAAVRSRGGGAITIAEESTAWPGVTAPPPGLGFDFKWNMGWMHDTLRYLAEDPLHRAHHHDEMTFGLVYAFSERFILPLSHDEVVYGKGSLIGKAPGDDWRRFAALRAYYAFMHAHPGKKLLFMGGEIGQYAEWSHDGELAWDLLRGERHAGLQTLVRDLNRLHAEEGALHERDASGDGFAWIVIDDRANSVFAFERRGGDDAAPLLFVANFTPIPRHGYRLGAPRPGAWRTLLNTDAEVYGGGNVGPPERVWSEPTPSHGRADSLTLDLPPLGGLFLKWDATTAETPS